MAGYGSLSLIAPASLEEGQAQLSVTQQAMQYVTDCGFHFPDLPQQNYRGVMPSDISHLNDEQLGILLSEIAAWASYGATKLSIAKQACNEAESKLNFIKCRIRIAVRSSEEYRKLSNPDKDDLVGADPRVLEAERTFRFYEAVHDYTKELMSAAQRDWDTVSRHITQRGQETERNRRGENVGSIPVMSGAFRKS